MKGDNNSVFQYFLFIFTLYSSHRIYHRQIKTLFTTYSFFDTFSFRASENVMKSHLLTRFNDNIQTKFKFVYILNLESKNFNVMDQLHVTLVHCFFNEKKHYLLSQVVFLWIKLWHFCMIPSSKAIKTLHNKTTHYSNCGLFALCAFQVLNLFEGDNKGKWNWPQINGHT